MFSSFFMTEP